MRTKLLTLSLSTSILALALASPSVDAYTLNNPRGGNSTVLYLDPNVAVTMPDHYTKLQDAAVKLNANPSNMRFSLLLDNDLVFAKNNGESEVSFSSDTTLLCGSRACAHNISSGGVLIESDVYFDINHDWATTDAKADSLAYDSSEGRPLINTAMHEFNHTIGMGHEDQYFQIMGNAWNVVNTNGSSTELVISEDTANGLVAHYGLRPDVNEDLSLYHWEQVSASAGGYSQHGRLPLESAPGVLLQTTTPFDPNLDEPAYLASSGQTILVWQTAENRGTSQTVTIKWYLSGDANITTLDTQLASSSITLSRNTPYTWDRSVTLPNLVPGKRYWVGAIIDTANVVAEQNEINNAIYVAEIVGL
mgnify:CR=1 FL=1